jgi:hypothetical protein
MNIDYSFCQALQSIKDIGEVLFIYDIGCEWERHFLDRVEANKFLHLEDNLKIITAVGKFHLGAHVKECFSLYSLNFILGIGELDGEILETLWSSLGKVAGQTRGMSQAHRQEVLDDHMNDSNWKKMINSGENNFILL